MRVHNFLEATNGFNPEYRCFFEKNQKKIPLSNFTYDKGNNRIVLYTTNDSKAIRLQELMVICKVIDPNALITIKINDQIQSIFGFKIVDLKKIIFA